MGTHAVGVGLDQGRAAARTCSLEGRCGGCVDREHVIAIDTYAGEPEARSPAIQRNSRLPLNRFRDRPLIVLAEEDDWCVVGAGENERLVDIALAGSAVAEVADDRHVAVGVASADESVAFHTHRVAGGMQRLRPDDDRVEVETRLLRIPAAKINSAEQGQQVHRVNAEAPRDTMLAIGRKDEVLFAERSSGAHLRRLLAQTGSPQPKFTLTL